MSELQGTVGCIATHWRAKVNGMEAGEEEACPSGRGPRVLAFSSHVGNNGDAAVAPVSSTRETDTIKRGDTRLDLRSVRIRGPFVLVSDQPWSRDEREIPRSLGPIPCPLTGSKMSIRREWSMPGSVYDTEKGAPVWRHSDSNRCAYPATSHLVR